MKIRKHKKREWWFFPPENSPLEKGRCYKFKYKDDLIKFISKNFNLSLNGVVQLEEKSFGGSQTIRMWTVWYNDYKYKKGCPLKLIFKQEKWTTKNGGEKKYFYKKYKISKESKKYFAFSDKTINQMLLMANPKLSPKEKKENAKRLVKTFVKRGFKDFIPNEEEQEYINYYLEKGIDFFHWSDRCNWLRTKTVIEYFKKEKWIEI
jgi:hypothetical protein